MMGLWNLLGVARIVLILLYNLFICPSNEKKYEFIDYRDIFGHKTNNFDLY